MDVRSAAERWTNDLLGWAIPQNILDEAPESPWSHDPAIFAAGDDMPRDTRSVVVAREVLPRHVGSVLDVGCGGGRASLPLAPPAELIVGVDASEAMLQSFSDAATRAGIVHATVLGRWPDVCADGFTPITDVVVCHHVLYNVPDVVPFLEALTAHARLAVVIEVTPAHPQATWNEAWHHFRGIERPTRPTAHDLVAVLREMGHEPEVWTGPKPTMASGAGDPARVVASLRRRLCFGADRDAEVAEWLAVHPPVWSTEVVTIRWAGGGGT
jgi:SAM-dependent methyltransferase